MVAEKASYRRAITISVCLHVVIIVLMSVSWVGGFNFAKAKARQQKQKPIVHATAVSEKAVQQELQRLAKIDAREKAKQKRLERQAREAKKRRLAEEKRLKALKQKQLQEKKQAEAKRLAEQKKATERLKQVQEKLAAEQKRLKQAEAQRVAEQARLQKIEEQREIERRQQEAAAKAKALAEEKERQARRAQEIKRQQDKLIQAEVDRFGFMVQQKVTRNWLIQGLDTDGASCILKVRLGVGGVVLDVVVLQSSGDSAMDRSAVAAVYKSSPLPVPENPQAFERMRELRLTLKPKDILKAG